MNGTHAPPVCRRRRLSRARRRLWWRGRLHHHGDGQPGQRVRGSRSDAAIHGHRRRRRRPDGDLGGAGGKRRWGHLDGRSLHRAAASRQLSRGGDQHRRWIEERNGHRQRRPAASLHARDAAAQRALVRTGPATRRPHGRGDGHVHRADHHRKRHHPPAGDRAARGAVGDLSGHPARQHGRALDPEGGRRRVLQRQRDPDSRPRLLGNEERHRVDLLCLGVTLGRNPDRSQHHPHARVHGGPRRWRPGWNLVGGGERLCRGMQGSRARQMRGRQRDARRTRQASTT